MKVSVLTIFILILVSFHTSGQTTKTAKPTTTTKTNKPVTTKTTKTTKSSKTTKSTKTTTAKIPVKQEPQFLLVKVKSSLFNHYTDNVDIRLRMEDKIDDELSATKNGEWVSGDMGPGEANMLFKVLNVEQAQKIALKVVNEEKFEKTIIMGIRTSNADPKHWTYKAIYPPNYKGTL